MPNFSQRSLKEELLDQEQPEREALHKNLAELETINRWLGGHQATLRGLQRLMSDPNRRYHIVDYACGGGDTLRFISDWAKRKNLKVKLSGFDLLPEAIEFAETHSANYSIDFHCADFNDYQSEEPVDIACCALVCHHFYGANLKNFLGKMKADARVGVVINDLHRHPLAYHSIKWITALFSNSSFVKNDAPLSVLKGFRKAEWEELLEEVDYQPARLQWVWAFRHLITHQTTDEEN